MEKTSGNLVIREGTDVYGADGEKVGSVVAAQPSYVVVEKGFFFPTDYYIPASAIARADGDGVYLNVTKDAALNQGWDVEPTADAAASNVTTVGAATAGTVRTDVDDYDAPPSFVASGAGYAADMGSETVDVTGVETAAPAVAPATDTAPARAATRSAAGRTKLDEDDVPFEHYEDTAATHVDAEQGVVVPVHEEELTAVTRERELGEVRVEKDVVAEERTLQVPVTEERVRVERHAVDRAVGADEAAFEEGVIEVPVHGEEVQLQKQTKVAEEVEIGKEAVQRTEQVAGTVRREEVRVDETVVDGEAGTRRDR